MRPKLLFLATEDWFVRSHFSALVARAVADGFETVVAARRGDAARDLEGLGARVVNLTHARGDNSALAMAAALRDVRRLFRAERPAIIHAIALKPVALASLSLGAAPSASLICAVTGRGHLATVRGAMATSISGAVRSLISAQIASGRALALVENRDDRTWLERGRRFASGAVSVLPGAGVDANRFCPAPEPDGPVRIGMAARLVRSKGIDAAVEAFAGLRLIVPDAELHIAGKPDRENPGAYGGNDLSAWGATPGVRLRGFVDDMPRFWREMNVAVLTSRGGEGLPRSLIEAAACGRPIVTTDVAGCREFVEAGVTGLVTPMDEPSTLVSALTRLALDPGVRRRMGDAGRAKVVAGYTTHHVSEIVSRVWAHALASRGVPR